MPHRLINHNPDLKKLSEEGYDLEIENDKYLLVRCIPYVNAAKQVKSGTLVCILNLPSPTKLSPPSDHTIYFQGEVPCDASGHPLEAIINNSNAVRLTENILVNHYFSSKPTSGNYRDYYEKIRTYAEILSSQARVINKSVTPRPKKTE